MRRGAALRRASGASAGDASDPADKLHGKQGPALSSYVGTATAFVVGVVVMMLFVRVGQAPGGGRTAVHQPGPVTNRPKPDDSPVLDVGEVLVVSDRDEPGDMDKAWKVLNTRGAKPPVGGAIRMPSGVGAKLDSMAQALRRPVERLLLEGRAVGPGDHSTHASHDTGSVVMEDDDGALEAAGLLPTSEPGVWDADLVDEFAANWPTDALLYGEMLTITRALRVSRLLRGGLSEREVLGALNRPRTPEEEDKGKALRQRARGAAMISFGVSEDLMLWAETNPGGLIVAIAAEQWWSESQAQAAKAFMGACEEAHVCCAVARVPWHTTVEKDDKPHNVGNPGMVLSGVVDAAADGFKSLHVGGAQAEAECRAWSDGTAGSLPWRFDVALIRAPHAYQKRSPGRMASIATAAELVGPGAHVFVRDLARKSEKRWTAGYFGSAPQAALPTAGRESVETITMTDGAVIVPRSPGVDKSIPDLGDPSAKWTDAGLRAFAGSSEEDLKRGDYPFLGMVDKLGHFRAPGRVAPTTKQAPKRG